jgi:hypothetical protein
VDGNGDDDAPDDNLKERLTDPETPVQQQAINSFSFKDCLDEFIPQPPRA